MRISLSTLVCCLPLLARAQDGQQVTFGLTQGAELTKSTTETAGTDGVPATVQEEQLRVDDKIIPSTGPTGSELHASALSLLTTLTAHASLSTASTTYTPLLRPSSYTPFLDLLEFSLSPFAAKVVRGTRRVVGYLYGGGGGGGGRDWSVRGAVRALGRVELRTPRGEGVSGRKWWEDGGLAGRKLGRDEVRDGMEEVLRRAKAAGEKGAYEGWVLVGDLYLSGHLTLEPNAKIALEAYTRASEEGGIPEAQYKLGFLYGSNYGAATGGVEGVGKQGSALLHYTFAALSAHVPSSLAVGYRHWVGIGTKQSCKDALGWYKSAADSAMQTFNAGPPGGRHLPPPKIRLSDLEGGAFGPGASASSRPHITGGSSAQTQQEWDDLLEYQYFHAERGDAVPMFRLGRLYYQGFGGGGLGGARGGKGRLDVGMGGLNDGMSEGGRDFGRAAKWFMKVAGSVWQKDLKEVTTSPTAKKGEQKIGFYDPAKDVKQTTDDHFNMVAGLSAGFLGRMYMRGEGVRVDYAKAFFWFMRGSSQGDRESNNGLGIIFRDGLGVEPDLKKANALFLAAAQQDLAEAQVNLGKYHFGIGEYALATAQFELAIRQDPTRVADSFQAYYYLAELSAHAVNRPDQCPSAVAFYKYVAERGDWEHEVWWEAERALTSGDERTAMLGYWIMAERGYEVAQNNVAWILDRDKKRLRLPLLDAQPASNLTDRLALAYWTRSAAQDNVDALVKMGDYYYAGLGVDEPQLEKAAANYQSAANSRTSALAMWNLGWMHENGKGVAQDYHLAKRYYDMALETSADAYFPATLSLISLYARSFYHSLFGANDDLKTLSLFTAPPLEEGSVPAQPWSLDRAWRAMKRQWGIDPGPDPAGQEGVQEVGGTRAERRQDVVDAQREWEGDDLDWARMDDEEEDEFGLDGDGDFTGTVGIIVLCVTLGWLLYFRQGRLPAEPARFPRQPAPPVPAAAPAQAVADPNPPAAQPTPPPIPPDARGEDETTEV